MTDTQRGGPAPEGRVETSDAPPGQVAIGVGIFAGILLLGLIVSALLLRALNRGHAPSAGAQAQSEVQPPPPRLQADPRAERLRLEAEARKRLEQGAVPIEQAMRDVVARGWDR